MPNYIGLDVSKTAIKICKQRFKDDKTKIFLLYDPDHFLDNHHIFNSEIALSLDVIYHLVEDRIFNKHMKSLFSVADKYVIIYSTDTDENPSYTAPHCKNRRFSKWIETNSPDWKLVERIKNKYPNESACDFYI